MPAALEELSLMVNLNILLQDVFILMIMVKCTRSRNSSGNWSIEGIEAMALDFGHDPEERDA